MHIDLTYSTDTELYTLQVDEKELVLSINDGLRLASSFLDLLSDPNDCNTLRVWLEGATGGSGYVDYR